MSVLEPPKTKPKRKKLKKFPKNPDNPSPSGDPYWDNPANLADLDEAIEEMKAGKTMLIGSTKEEIRKYIESL